MITPGRVALLISPQNIVYVWDGSKWAMETLYVRNNTEFNDATFVKQWNGTSWVPTKLR